MRKSATNISEGRGRATPFRVAGAPWMAPGLPNLLIHYILTTYLPGLSVLNLHSHPAPVPSEIPTPICWPLSNGPPKFER
ncbi:DUF1343 domain-containing protein [Chitinophaga varians]|uniref:DUF1343 domain-containing protein n=1 Tax=Chitinophaga varians TaxID=2202339 RepID=A0A847S3B3_9BACT|nr:DUF1343 domain-containing protein [Chitinophaga varians]